MTQKEMRLKRREVLSEKLSQIYESVEIDGRQCFVSSRGVIFRLDSLGGECNALVIEYADTLDLAKKGIFGEDGDLFYMDEFNEDEMLNAMIQEIEDAAI